MNNIRIFIIGTSLMLIVWLGASFSVNIPVTPSSETKTQAERPPQTSGDTKESPTPVAAPVATVK